METTSIIVAAGAILAISIAFSMVGLGGGVLYVPILLVLGISIHDAAIISLFMIAVMSTSAAIIYRRHSTIDWKLALVIEPPIAALAFAGGLLAHYIDATVLKITFAGVLIVASILMMKQVKERKTDISHSWGYWNRKVGDNKYSVHLSGLVPVTTTAGFVSGMIGVGGGIFNLPAMMLIGHVPMRIAIGTSSLMVAVTAIAGFSGHIITGSFDILTALPLAVVAFIGGRLGSSLSSNVRVPILKVFVAITLFFVSIWMIVSTLT